MIQQKIKVNGLTVTVNPFSRKRFNDLRAINAEINEWINANATFTLSDIPDELRETWWRRKADILWSVDVTFAEGFFSDEEFESSLLAETESEFYTKMVYL
jgi:hypothetical protein